MRACNVEIKPRLQTKDNTRQDIREYGEFNDYPQKLLYITGSSATAAKCLNIYKRFVVGQGFDPSLNAIQINEDYNAYELLSRIAEDHCIIGRCYHINYNELGSIASISHIPFEYLRMEIDEDKKLTGKLLIYDDWDCIKRGRIDEDLIIKVNRFNPDNVINELPEKGIEFYAGQVLYPSAYPLAIYDAVVTDMSTEDHVATVKFRNCANNFLPSGMLITKKVQAEGEGDNDESELTEQIASWQGSENSNKIIHIESEFNETDPKFVEFPSRNFDKEFEYTEKSIQTNIGNQFMQPGILRGELIAGKLGTATDFQDAYQYYNIVTEIDRKEITEEFNMLMKYWNVPISGDFKIIPLSYGVNQ